MMERKGGMAKFEGNTQKRTQKVLMGEEDLF